MVDEVGDEKHECGDDDYGGDDCFCGEDRDGHEHGGAGVAVVDAVSFGESGDRSGVGRGGHLEPEAQDDGGELEDESREETGVDWVFKKPDHLMVERRIGVDCSIKWSAWGNEV